MLVHQGFEWTRYTAGSGDRGSDVVGHFKNRYWVLQAKFSINAIPPGPRAITYDLMRAINEYGAEEALLATNGPLVDASALRRAAVDFERNTGVRIQLLGRKALLTMANALPQDPVPRGWMPLRRYQAVAVEAVHSAQLSRVGAAAGALVAMATGTGKSRVMFEYFRLFLAERPGSEIMVLVEGVELARQLERASWEILPKGITTHLWAEGDTPAFSCGDSVTFATTDKVRADWKILARAGRFALIVVDEAHHAASATTARLLRELKPAFRLGMTATPWRGDQRRVELLFGGSEPVFRLSIVDAIRERYLAEVQYLVFDDHVDWDEVKRLSRSGLTIRDLNRRLWVPERENRIAGIVRSMIDELSAGGLIPRTLVFCRSIEHTEKARMALNAAGVPAAPLHSGLDKFATTRTLQKFRDGDLRVLTVVDMLNEGIDVPDVKLVVFNRVTHSRRVFLQQLGRGLRRTPDKERLVVLDFVADVRRIVELEDMEREYQSGVAAHRSAGETVDLPSHLVTFRGEEMTDFVSAYLRDVADLSSTSDDALVLFPASTAPD